MTGVAVNVTRVPLHTGFAEAEIEMLTGKFGFTVMMIWFDVAGFPVEHGRLDVKTQQTVSPFAGV